MHAGQMPLFMNVTNDVILREISDRLKRKRLNKNITRKEIVKKTGLSLKTIRNIESGLNFSMDTLICYLRALNLLDEIDSFIKPEVISPVDLSRRKGKVRMRASKKGRDKGSTWQWG